MDEAASVVEAAVTLSGGHPWAVSLVGMIAARAGRTDEALEVVRELVERRESGSGPFVVPPLAVALVYSQLEDTDAYFEWMERAAEARDGWLVMLCSDPSYRHQDDPRHAALAERVGIPGGAGDVKLPPTN